MDVDFFFFFLQKMPCTNTEQGHLLASCYSNNKSRTTKCKKTTTLDQLRGNLRQKHLYLPYFSRVFIIHRAGLYVSPTGGIDHQADPVKMTRISGGGGDIVRRVEDDGPGQKDLEHLSPVQPQVCRNRGILEGPLVLDILIKGCQQHKALQSRRTLFRCYGVFCANALCCSCSPTDVGGTLHPLALGSALFPHPSAAVRLFKRDSSTETFLDYESQTSEHNGGTQEMIFLDLSTAKKGQGILRKPL